MLGVKEGENLFVEADGAWKLGRYVPAYVRRYPFIVTETPDKAAQLLAIDSASDRFVSMATDSNPADTLFDDRGTPTAVASGAMAFCNAYHQDHLKTQAFVDALAGAGLLTANHAQMQLPDGSRYTLDGFMSVDEQKFRGLPATRVAEWHAKGWLDLVALHLVSELAGSPQSSYASHQRNEGGCMMAKKLRLTGVAVVAVSALRRVDSNANDNALAVFLGLRLRHDAALGRSLLRAGHAPVAIGLVQGRGRPAGSRLSAPVPIASAAGWDRPRRP